MTHYPPATPIIGIAFGVAQCDSITSQHAMRFVTFGAALGFGARELLFPNLLALVLAGSLVFPSLLSKHTGSPPVALR